MFGSVATNTMGNHVRFRIALAFIVSLYALPALATPIVSVQPATKTVAVGQTFSLDISVASVVDLYAFEFDLGFNPTELSVNSVTEGPFLGTGGSTFFVGGTVNNVSGSITFTADSLETAIVGVNGGGVLATVQFTAHGAGSGLITPFNITLLDSQLSGIPATVATGTVNVTGVTAVPEPSALLLVGTGLAVVRRWRTSQPPA